MDQKALKMLSREISNMDTVRHPAIVRYKQLIIDAASSIKSINIFSTDFFVDYFFLLYVYTLSLVVYLMLRAPFFLLFLVDCLK